MYKNYKPLVTVIIPAWNEEVGIRQTLLSVLNNTYKKTEIIVINDGSSDATSSSVGSISDKYPGRIRLIEQKNTGKSGALNNGVLNASGTLVLTLDADSFLEADSIAKMVDALSDKRFSVAIGEVIVGNTKNWLGYAQHFEYTVGFHVKRAQHIFDSAYIFPGALTMFRSSVLRKTGEFTDYSSTEDLDISMRIKMAGHKIAYVDDAVCITEGASSVKGLLNQRTRWRHGYLECLRFHKDFLFSFRKGRYLTLIDLPLQLFGLLEVLLFPVIILTLGYLVFISANIPALILAYSIVPFALLLLGDMREKHSKKNLWVFLMPIMLVFIEFIEFIALLKSIYRLIRRKRTEWTVWQRSGASA